MKFILWPVVAMLTLGVPFGLYLFWQTGNPIALVDTVWCGALLAWAIWLLNRQYMRG